MVGSTPTGATKFVSEDVMQAPWTPEYGYTGHGDIGAFYFLIGLLVFIGLLKLWDYYHPEEPSDEKDELPW